ncbi:peptidase domain-containing ABC transporter [Bacillus cereus]|uniref:Peptidase domain-containing ABC transporter n=2 Tax=Bacillus cereus TaxID=1396 RepID=A0A9X8IVQ2_BACCE|nr:peptidase domain-containing ABC transporter [Bacillus cereus]
MILGKYNCWRGRRMYYSKNRKIPFVEQLQQTECGLCCVAMILRYYNSNQPISEIRRHLEPGRDGTGLKHLYQLLNDLGFHSRVYKTTVEGLKQVTLPAILHWDNNHFVILEKIKNNKFYIIDPALGRKTLSENKIESMFSNYVLTTKPTEKFIPITKKNSVFKTLLPDVFSNKLVFLKLFLLTFFVSAITLSIPIMIQKLIDGVTIHNTLNINTILLFAGLLILYGLLLLTRGKYIVDIRALLDRSLLGKVFSHLLKIPYKFFEVRAKGDLLYRINSMNIIRDLLSEKVIGSIMDVSALVFMTFYMLYKSPVLTILVLVLFLISIGFTLFMHSYIKEYTLYEMVERSKLSKIQTEAISAIFTVKVSGIEDNIYNAWKNKLNDVLFRYKKQANLLNVYTTFTQMMQTISPFLVLLLGLKLYTEKNITLGEVIAFYSLAVMFFSYSFSIFQTWNNFIAATNTLERIQDITNEKIEKEGNLSVPNPIKGDIKLENVTFSYSKYSNPVIKDLSLHIKSGQKVAIVGASGSGKSTLGKLLLGLYTPNSGDIFYDSLNFKGINKKQLRKQIGVVPQEIYLFNESIYDNIRLGHKNVDIHAVKRAAEIAQISDEIEKMPMHYNTLVSDMGLNFSGGQRQRIALAKALLNDPRIMVLDEATSSLDSINEANIANHFKNIGCTCIIIAHRLSTIVDSDIIYVLDDGKIVEQGTHTELMNLQGKYCKLYTQGESSDNSIKIESNEELPKSISS